MGEVMMSMEQRLGDLGVESVMMGPRLLHIL